MAYAPNHNHLSASSRLVRLSYRPRPLASRFGASRARSEASQAKPPRPAPAHARSSLEQYPREGPLYGQDRPGPDRSTRGMRRDAAAVPTAAAASQPVAAAEVWRSEAVVIDVEGEPQTPQAAPAGAACRICHLVPEGGVEPGSEVIRIGCSCKDELGAAHRHCAEAWFRIKGDRCCEICGSDAKNIIGLEMKKFMEEWHGQRVANMRTTTERASTCWRTQPFCNFLLACLLIAFILPWFLATRG